MKLTLALGAASATLIATAYRLNGLEFALVAAALTLPAVLYAALRRWTPNSDNDEEFG